MQYMLNKTVNMFPVLWLLIWLEVPPFDQKLRYNKSYSSWRPENPWYTIDDMFNTILGMKIENYTQWRFSFNVLGIINFKQYYTLHSYKF